MLYTAKNQDFQIRPSPPARNSTGRGTEQGFSCERPASASLLAEYRGPLSAPSAGVLTSLPAPPLPPGEQGPVSPRAVREEDRAGGKQLWRGREGDSGLRIDDRLPVVRPRGPGGGGKPDAHSCSPQSITLFLGRSPPSLNRERDVTAPLTLLSTLPVS